MRVFLSARVMPSGGRVLRLRLLLLYWCSYLHPSVLELTEEGCYFCGYSSLFGVFIQPSCCYGFPKIFAALYFFLRLFDHHAKLVASNSQVSWLIDLTRWCSGCKNDSFVFWGTLHSDLLGRGHGGVFLARAKRDVVRWVKSNGLFAFFF